MESENSSIKIDQLEYSNYHYRKIRVQHVLDLKDLYSFLEEDPTTDSAQLAAWNRKDRKAQAIIGLTLSNDLLKNVRVVVSTKIMWFAIKNIFERHTLLYKLSTRRKFCSATMNSNESVLKFSNRISHIAATLKSINVSISESEMAMALLNGLTDDYNALIGSLTQLMKTNQNSTLTSLSPELRTKNSLSRCA